MVTTPLLLAENGDIFIMENPTCATVYTGAGKEPSQPANEISNNLICILSSDDKVSISQSCLNLFIWDIVN